MGDPETNVLFYGNNLEILRRYVPDESVDLIYFDPPFNSNGDYNVIFRDESGNCSDALRLACEDIGKCALSAEAAYRGPTTKPNPHERVSQTPALRRLLAS